MVEKLQGVFIPFNVILLYQDYRRELRRLADFMNLHVSDETIAAIAEKGQFKSMTEELKSDQKIMEFSKRLNADGNLPFYRKGNGFCCYMRE